MKADPYGTHSEQIRARHGWLNASRARATSSPPCWKCGSWLGGTSPRGACSVMECGTSRNASCRNYAPRVMSVATCRWTDERGEYWETECGHQFCLIDGTPSENGMAYCCYCGKRLDDGSVR